VFLLVLKKVGITKDNGDTVWENSGLIRACVRGSLVILDGVHRLHRGTIAVLQRLSIPHSHFFLTFSPRPRNHTF
jgi:hypothetical protein